MRPARWGVCRALVPPAAHLAALIAAIAAGGTPVHAVIPLPSSPSWSSIDNDYATGGALVDLDGDGDVDLVTSNGNDMESERNAAYYNVTGDSLERRASWHSADFGYHGQLAIGDVDGDGDPDVAVARYGQGVEPLVGQQDRLYRNVGGVLETTPSWVSGDFDNSFALAFGDVDGDGDLDLAAACGESYTLHPQRLKLYLNHGGALSTTADWQSDLSTYAYDVAWGDVDGDGDLDLAAANERGPNHVYRNLGAMLETAPSWISGDDNHTIGLDWGDVEGDGDLDLAVADNNQIGDRASRVRLYRNNGGTLEALPFWTSGSVRQYYSCVRWGDVDFDGDLDLAAGGWWEPVEVYENHGGLLETTASWSWHPAVSSNLVCEQLAWADVDGRSRFTFQKSFNGDGARHLFYLGTQPVDALLDVKVSGVSLAPSEYALDLEAGWISLATAPPAGAGTLLVRYRASASLDLVVTNWVKNSPNHLFRNGLATPTAIALDHRGAEPRPVGAPAGGTPLALRASPNPTRAGAAFRFTTPAAGRAQLSIVTVDGREVRTLSDETAAPGARLIAWDGRDERGRVVPAGIYVARLRAAGQESSEKILVIR